MTSPPAHMHAVLLTGHGGPEMLEYRDVVADLVAGPMFRDLLNIVRPEGRYVTAGAIAGPVVELDLRTMYLKHLDLIGCSQGTRKEFADVLGYALRGEISPLVAGTYPLSQIHRAQTDFVEKAFVGKLVVVPDRVYSARGAPRDGPRSQGAARGPRCAPDAW